ncbi:MAG: glycerate kinase [Collinsella intestinalis]
MGPRGAARMFGPQKGLGVGLSEVERDEVLAACDGWMAAYGARLTAARDALDGSAEQVGRPGARPKSLLGVPGSGAAGGLGAALLALGAELVPGIEAVLGMAGFDDAVRAADLVVTGEGASMRRPPRARSPWEARRAKRLRPDVPVIAVCGSREDELEAVYAAGVDAVLPVGAAPQALDEALDPDCARRNLRMVVRPSTAWRR